MDSRCDLSLPLSSPRTSWPYIVHPTGATVSVCLYSSIKYSGRIICPASHGMSTGTALGFFWTLPATAERRGLYRFATDLGRLALKIADKHGSISEKWFDSLHGPTTTHLTLFSRVRVLFCGLIASFDQVHLGTHLELLGEAARYGETAGDR